MQCFCKTAQTIRFYGPVMGKNEKVPFAERTPLQYFILFGYVLHNRILFVVLQLAATIGTGMPQM
jgi:hypothetical protein